MSRSWFSNFQGAADWATGNRWDFDNMGKGSVADSNPPSAYDNNDGGYKPSWADAFKVADKWNQGNKGGYMPGYMSKGPMNWPTPGVTKIGANSVAWDPTVNWWNKYQVSHAPVDNSPSGLSKALGIGGSLVGLVNPAAGVAMKAGAQFV
tara:strand:+ start:231 stop:680 length:450 start_codon:yes stop_codon:yes gene_type:complete